MYVNGKNDTCWNCSKNGRGRNKEGCGGMNLRIFDIL
jgi:hypothetical protein